MYADLASFVEALDRAGELVRVREPVSPVCEIAAIADLVSKSHAPAPGSDETRRTDPEFHDRGGPAILFENVPGSDLPVLINAFGSYRRIEMALGGRPLEAIAAQIAELVKPEPPRSIGEAIAKAKQFAPLLKIGPKRLRGKGACQQVVVTGDAIDLTRLPMLRCWAHDGDFEALGYPAGVNDGVPGLGHPGIDADEWERTHRGRYITLAGIHTIHPDDRGSAKPKSHNIGMYRVQLLGKDRVAMHWHMHHDGASHWRAWKKLGEPMPVAIALGGSSVLPYAATCPLPPGISELLMAGFLGGRGVRLCRASSVPLWVPADADIVIEGLVRTDAGFPGWDPREPDAGPLGDGAVFEGPFGDHTGFYSMPDRYPIVEVSAVTRREHAIYPTTVVGLPPQEDYFLGKATERIMRPLLETLMPDLEDYHLPMFGAFHNCAFVQIDKAYPLHGRRVMHGVWGAGQMSWTKSVFVVDGAVNVHDATEVLGAAARWCRPSEDIEVTRGPLDILDHASPHLAAGTKIGFDCTPTREGERTQAGLEPRELPTCEQMDADAARARAIDGVLAAHADDRAPGWLFIEADRGHGEPGGVGLGRRILDAFFGSGPGACPFVVVVGRGVDVRNHHDALFHWLANSDAGRDAVWSTVHWCDRVGFDATPKTSGDGRAGLPARAWPPVLTIDDETLASVRAKAERLGLGSHIAAG
ncbi:MAG: UbiD family decarboxylase [Phycisphaerales bacterium]